MTTDWGRRLIVPLTGLVLLAGVAVIHQIDPALYRRVMTVWMLNPFNHPFIDWEWLPSSAECWSKGVDVYVDNTCYHAFQHGQFNYSPLWLRATFLPYGEEWVAPMGMGLAALFCLAQAFLPTPQRPGELAVRLLATYASLPVFALERGNADLFLFVLTILGIHLVSGRLPMRLAGYGVFLFIGLLKFYPLVLLSLALRESPRVFAWITGVATLIVLGFVWMFYAEIVVTIRNLPKASYFGDTFGAVNLPTAGVTLVADFARSHGVDVSRALVRIAQRLVMTALVVSSIAYAIWLIRRQKLGLCVAQMPQLDANFLVAGTLLICGCFFVGQSVGYRGIFLLLVLPGLLHLSQSLPQRQARLLMVGVCVALLSAMWLLTEQFFIFALPEPLKFVRAVFWFIHELTWWWMVATLLAVLFSFPLATPLFDWLRRVNVR